MRVNRRFSWRIGAMHVLGLMIALTSCSHTVNCKPCPGYYFYADASRALANRAQTLDVCSKGHPCVTLPLDDPAYSTPTYEGALAMLGISGVEVHEGTVDLVLKDKSGNVIGHGTGAYQYPDRSTCQCRTIHIKVE
ncbi:hypothetical protein [Streptosporangium sp. NPDC000396]|uniref:hypothetical protein n=1 Tax=Streptosporangium sp. NPDC000396 TaxID=3366185 RepID=UPI0036A33C32